MSTRILTGITTTGTPHLGNYAGAIRPAIVASREAGVDSFYFLADYHALIKCGDPDRVQESRLKIAATWLACGAQMKKFCVSRSMRRTWLSGTTIQPMRQPVIEKYLEKELMT